MVALTRHSNWHQLGSRWRSRHGRDDRSRPVAAVHEGPVLGRVNSGMTTNRRSYVRLTTRALLGVIAVAVVYVAVQSFNVGGMFGAASVEGVPAPVARLAWRFRLLHPRPDGVYAGETLERNYAHSFFDGFACGPSCGTSGGSTLQTDAYMAGVSYRTDHPRDVDNIMSGFGYRRLVVEGVWSIAMEKSLFAPNDQSGQAWWLEFFGNPDVIWPPQTPGASTQRSGDFLVRVTGYLSPEGHYGHGGRETRQVLAVAIAERRN